MKQIILILALLLGLGGCAFQRDAAADDASTAYSAVTTAETCTFTFDFSDPHALENTVVYKDANRCRIRLTHVEADAPNRYTLRFAADAAQTMDGRMLLSGSVPHTQPNGNTSFLHATLSVEPADAFLVYFAMQTSELTTAGNEFAIGLHINDPDSLASSGIHTAEITLSDLPQLIFPSP